jgi:hypothetical protein
MNDELDIITDFVILLHVSEFFSHPLGGIQNTSLRMAEIVKVFGYMLIQNAGLLIKKLVHSAHKINFCVFCVDLRTNSYYFPILHLLTGYNNRDGVFLLRGTDWIFIYNSGFKIYYGYYIY